MTDADDLTHGEMTGRVAAFLADLSEVTRKHRIAISGCCGSPHVYPLEEDDLPGGYYVMDEKERFESLGDIFGGQMTWVEPGSIWHASWPDYSPCPLIGPDGPCEWPEKEAKPDAHT